MRHRIKVLFPNGKLKTYSQLEGESVNEMYGRVLCLIEEKIMGKRLTPTPKGTRWAEWHIKPHNGGGICIVRESTGQPYANRTIALPVSAILSEEEAARVIGAKL